MFGAIEAAEGLLAGGEAGEGAQENGEEKSDNAELEQNTDISGPSSKASLASKSPPFEIHLLLVGDESVIANGANKVGAEAAEAALEEVYADPDAPKAPPPSLLAKCVYHVVATRVSPPPPPRPRPAPSQVLTTRISCCCVPVWFSKP